MSASPASGGITAKADQDSCHQIEGTPWRIFSPWRSLGVRYSKRKSTMRLPLIVAVIPALVLCNSVAKAQVTGMTSPTPSIAATSPLGLGTGSGVSQTGIPFGATEIASPGVSPAPGATGAI